MKNIFCFICLSVFLLGMAGFAQAVVLTFDDIGTSKVGTIHDGYGGFGWDGMGYTNGDDFSEKSGYNKAPVSGEYVAFNQNAGVATVSESEFDFNGVYLTAAWYKDLQIEVKGFKDGEEEYSRTVTVDKYGPVWFDFNFWGIDSLQFRSYGGTDADHMDGGSGQHFAMDNFTFNAPVPEPSTVILLGLGLVGFAGIRRKRVMQ